ncbi:MAG: fluoride efflux transporter CrcB [Muribaculaceae bacterium]|nr:fluoride efflux transporter CrcB [Alistipes senegalensis]MCM1473707.1 fluoride efflux transporter CrcB [Muribaculaceae bacterium]
MNFISVALGGGLGAVLRYCISLIPYKSDFPFLTLVTNFIGAFLIGLINGLAIKKGLSGNALLFLKTGLCGGFTTFSTFSLETFNLIENHHIILALVYIFSSIILCLAGVMLGMEVSA